MFCSLNTPLVKELDKFAAFDFNPFKICLWRVPTDIEVRLRLFPISEWPPDERLLLIHALLELLSNDEVGRWDIVFILEHPDIPAITDGEENQENNEAHENSSSFVLSIDSPEIIVIEDSNDNAADSASDADTADATGEVGVAGEQEDVNPDDNPSTAQLRQKSSEEAEESRCWEEPWDFESDSGNTVSSSAKESDDDDPLPGPSSKWTPRGEQSSISCQSTSSEDSEEECQSSLPWKRTRNAEEEESLECPSDCSEDSNDSGDEPLPGPSRKRRRDRAESDRSGK